MSERFENLNSQEEEEKDPNEDKRSLDHALQYGNLADLEALLDMGMDVDQIDFQGRTALQLMSAKGNKIGIEMLLSRGANVNAIFMFQDRVPMTSLDAAEQTKRTEIAETLRSHGAKTGRELTL